MLLFALNLDWFSFGFNKKINGMILLCFINELLFKYLQKRKRDVPFFHQVHLFF